MQPIWLLLVLCLASGNRWLLDDALPQARSTSMSAAYGCFAAVLGCVIWALLKEAPMLRGGDRRPGRWLTVLAGVFALTGPALCGWAAGRTISGNTGTLALALTPAVGAVVATAYGSASELAGPLWPGLAGLAGLLLMLPQPDLGSWRMDVALAAMPLLVGVGGGLAGRLSAVKDSVCMPVFRQSSWLAMVLGTAGGLFLLFGLLTGHGGGRGQFAALAAAADGFNFLLSLVVLLRLGVVRWSVQFLLTPLVTILEGVAFLHPVLSGRAWSGIVLLSLGAIMLLFRDWDGMSRPGAITVP